jgi:hypothetical protein
MRHTKVQECQDKVVKNMSMEDASKARRSLLTAHSRGMGRHGEHSDFDGIARGMVANAGGCVGSALSQSTSNALKGGGALVADVQALLHEDGQGEDDDDEDDGDGSQADGEAQGGASARKRKLGGCVPDQAGANKKPKGPHDTPPLTREKWFDAEAVLGQAKRAADTANEKLRQNIATAGSKGAAALASNEARSDKGDFKREAGALSNRRAPSLS